MERPPSKGTIWGADDADDLVTVAESEPVVALSDIRGFSDSDSEADDIEDRPDMFHRERISEERCKPEAKQPVPVGGPSSLAEAPPAIHQKTRTQATSEDVPETFWQGPATTSLPEERIDFRRSDSAGSESISENGTWECRSNDDELAKPGAARLAPAGLRQEAEEHTWAGGLFDCFSSVPLGVSNGLPSKQNAWSAPLALLCPWVTLGSNASLLQEEEPVGIKCLGLGRRGSAVAAVSFCCPLAIAPCIGVGVLAAFQRRQIMRKYNIPGHTSYEKWCLLPCLCAPCALHQHSVFLTEQQSWRSFAHQGKGAMSLAPDVQCMDRKNLLEADGEKDNCAPHTESVAGVDVGGIAIDADSDFGDEPGPEQEGASRLPEHGNGDKSDDPGNSGEAGTVEDEPEAQAGLSRLKFWSGILDDDQNDEIPDAVQNEGISENNVEGDQGESEGHSQGSIDKPATKEKAPSLSSFWHGILDEDDSKLEPDQGGKTPSTPGKADSETDNSPQPLGGLTKAGSAEISKRENKEMPHKSVASPASIWDGILPADDGRLPDSTAEPLSSDEEDWDSDSDTELISGGNKQSARRTSTGQDAAISAPQASASVGFWDGILDRDEAPSRTTKDPDTPERRGGAARPALALGRSSSSRGMPRPASASPGARQSPPAGSLRKSFGRTRSRHERSSSGASAATLSPTSPLGPNAKSCAASAWGDLPDSDDPGSLEKDKLLGVSAPPTSVLIPNKSPSAESWNDQTGLVSTDGEEIPLYQHSTTGSTHSTAKWASPIAMTNKIRDHTLQDAACDDDKQPLHTGVMVAGSDSDWDSSDGEA